MLGNILLGLLIIVIGGSLIYFSYNLTKVFGKIEWAEKYLGGTTQAFVLGGFITIVLGFLVMFGVMEPGNTDQLGSIKK